MSDRYGRADDAPDPNDPWLMAARYNDAEVTETEDFEKFWTDRGVEPKTIMYLAEQRAMRYALMRTGDTAVLDKTKQTNQAQAIRPTREQNAIMQFVMPTILDGMAMAWRAKELSE